jgi:hypothetical protein
VEQAIATSVKIVGFPPESLVRTMKGMGFALVDSDADVIIAYGGDGTLIGAERDFPEVRSSDAPRRNLHQVPAAQGRGRARAAAVRRRARGG